VQPSLTGSRCTPMEPPTTTTCEFRPEFCFATNSSEFATPRVTEEVALFFLFGLDNRKTGQVVALGQWAWDNLSDVNAL
jgi:hypothetical protein